jgi:hypothetical protein
MKKSTAIAAWLFFFFTAEATSTCSWATVHPMKQRHILIVERRNILRRGNLDTTSAAIVPLMKPQHWFATGGLVRFWARSKNVTFFDLFNREDLFYGEENEGDHLLLILVFA